MTQSPSPTSDSVERPPDLVPQGLAEGSPPPMPSPVPSSPSHSTQMPCPPPPFPRFWAAPPLAPPCLIRPPLYLPGVGLARSPVKMKMLGTVHLVCQPCGLRTYSFHKLLRHFCCKQKSRATVPGSGAGPEKGPEFRHRCIC